MNIFPYVALEGHSFVFLGELANLLVQAYSVHLSVCLSICLSSLLQATVLMAVTFYVTPFPIIHIE